MKGLNPVKNKVDEIIEELKISGFEDDVRDMGSYKSQLENDSNCIEALRNIAGRCHFKDLGNLNVSNFSGWDWLNKLGKLNSKCQQLIKRIEKTI